MSIVQPSAFFRIPQFLYFYIFPLFFLCFCIFVLNWTNPKTLADLSMIALIMCWWYLISNLTRFLFALLLCKRWCLFHHVITYDVWFASGRGEFGEEQHMDSTQLPTCHSWSLILSYKIKQEGLSLPFSWRMLTKWIYFLLFIISTMLALGTLLHRNHPSGSEPIQGGSPKGRIELVWPALSFSWYDLHKREL